MTDLRILLVSPTGEIGGGEQVLLSLARYLPKWGLEPALACMRPGPLGEVARARGLEVYEFQAHRYRQLPTVARGIYWLTRVIGKTRARLVHVNHAGHIYSGPATRIARVPEVLHLHDYPYRRDRIERWSMSLPSDGVIFTTRKVKSGYPHLCHLPHAVIPPTCIDPEYWLAFPPRADIRSIYGLGTGPLFLTVARLQEHKGHRYLLEAIARVSRDYPDALFAIVGKPNGLESEKYLLSLLARSEALGIQNRLKFLGYVPDEDLASLYREATALVHPAISEGFGLVLLEAMILGTPIIAAAADGPSELLADTRTGLLVPTRDSTSLAGAIVRSIENSVQVATSRAEVRDAAQRFRVETMVEATVEMYRTLLDRR